MSKNKIITFMLVCAAVCSILAGYLIYHYMSPSRTTIYIFNSDYSAGEQIKSSMLTPLQVDSTAVAAGRTTNISTALVTSESYTAVIQSGDSLRMDVSEGMPLTTAMLSVSGGSTIEMNMTQDAIAVTVPVDSFSGITNDLKEGSRVNVYATTDSVTVLIQQNKRILEVFRSGGEITGIALEQTISESLELINAMNRGSIYLGLVDATGYQASEGADPYYVSDTAKYLLSGETYTDDGSSSYIEEFSSFDQQAFMEDMMGQTEAQTEAESESTDNVFTP